jgi:hypothetical protein
MGEDGLHQDQLGQQKATPGKDGQLPRINVEELQRMEMGWSNWEQKIGAREIEEEKSE